MDIKDFQDQYFGFEVKCKKCGSKKVYLENNIGYAESCGTWGSIDMICSDCDNRAEIVEA